MVTSSESLDSTMPDTAREIVATRVFAAPRELVFRMWTEREHIVNWWGPLGFTNTIEEMDVRPGGHWRFVMHGPDGTDYKNHSVYNEVVAPELLTYTHLSGPVFDAIVTFGDQGDETLVTMRMIFETAEAREHVATKFGAVEGQKQTLSRLADLLARTASAEPPFIIERTFDAPRELVWAAWTDPKHLLHWWGPKGFTVIHCEVDLRPGGTMHYGLGMPAGGEMWGKWVYREVVRPERLVFIASFSDKDANIAKPPFPIDWPLETLSTLTLTERDGRTTVRMEGIPVNATAEQRKIFLDGHSSMQMGWTGTLDALGAYLAEAVRA
jgi:uncharacterized protein YndB with AHSA1/START domain